MDIDIRRLGTSSPGESLVAPLSLVCSSPHSKVKTSPTPVVTSEWPSAKTTYLTSQPHPNRLSPSLVVSSGFGGLPRLPVDTVDVGASSVITGTSERVGRPDRQSEEPAMTEGAPTDTVAPAAEAVSFRFARGVLSFVGSPIEHSQNLLVDRKDSAEVAAPLAPLRMINSYLEEVNR